MKYILVIRGITYYRPFAHLGFESISDSQILYDRPNEVALVVFTGGEDIDPSLYGHKNTNSYINISRDRREKAIFDRALELKIPMAGICRGAQFLCAMAGGSIIQDVTKHTNSHRVIAKNEFGRNITSPELISSTHHQMQYPWDINRSQYEILAWSPGPYSSHYVHDGIHTPVDFAENRFIVEPDVVFYKNIGALAMQYHPEWMPEKSWGYQFARRLIDEKLLPLIKTRASRNVVEAAKSLSKVWK